MMGPHKNLQVWQNSMELVSLVYKKTRNFPRYEVFGLSSQMQRAAVSIPSNIAEGYGRASNPRPDTLPAYRIRFFKRTGYSDTDSQKRGVHKRRGIPSAGGYERQCNENATVFDSYTQEIRNADWTDLKTTKPLNL